MITPEDYYSVEPPSRIMGGENENDVQQRIVAASEDDVSFEDQLERTMRNMIIRAAVRTRSHDVFLYKPRIGNAKAWLSNGALIYNDCGHGEYSGPEVTGPENAAAADKAGVFVFNEFIEDSGVPHDGILRRSGSIMPVYRANGSMYYSAKTNGYHRNLMFPTSLFRRAGHLLPQTLETITAVSAWGWSGTLGPDGYEWSQKHRGIGTGCSHDMNLRTMEGKKPMVLFRNNGNKDWDVNPYPYWSRAEIRAVDPAQNLASLFLGYALPDLALCSLEHLNVTGNRLDRLQLKDPVAAMGKLALDPSLGSVLEMTDGRFMTADNILESYADVFFYLSERISLQEDRLKAIPLLQLTADLQRGVRYGEVSEFGLICHAARKLELLRREYDQEELHNRNARAYQIDLTFDRNDSYQTRKGERIGFGRRLAEHNQRYVEFDETFVPQSTVEHFIDHPDPNTRSIDRVELIRKNKQVDQNIVRMGWAGYSHDPRDIDDWETKKMNQWSDPYRQAA